MACLDGLPVWLLSTLFTGLECYTGGEDQCSLIHSVEDSCGLRPKVFHLLAFALCRSVFDIHGLHCPDSASFV